LTTRKTVSDGDEPSLEGGQITRKSRGDEPSLEGGHIARKSRSDEPSLEGGQIARISESTYTHISWYAVDIPGRDTEILSEENSEEEKENSESSSASETSNTDEEDRKEEDVKPAEGAGLSNEMRERLCLSAEPSTPTDVTLHPVLVEKWGNWVRKGLYGGEEDEEKKREEEENREREKIMKKFPRKAALYVEAPKLNPEILAYMSTSAKSRDKHFVSSQNALGSAMIAVAKSIPLLLELQEDETTSMLLEFLGNAGKLMAGLHHQHSTMRRAFILPGVDEKYRELLKKSEISADLFGNELFKRLKHTKSLEKVVEDLTPHSQNKKPLKSSNWGNKRSLPMRSKGHSQQARKSGGPLRFLKFKDRQRNSQWNNTSAKTTKSSYRSHHRR